MNHRQRPLRFRPAVRALGVAALLLCSAGGLAAAEGQVYADPDHGWSIGWDGAAWRQLGRLRHGPVYDAGVADPSDENYVFFRVVETYDDPGGRVADAPFLLRGNVLRDGPLDDVVTFGDAASPVAGEDDGRAVATHLVTYDGYDGDEGHEVVWSFDCRDLLANGSFLLVMHRAGRDDYGGGAKEVDALLAGLELGGGLSSHAAERT